VYNVNQCLCCRSEDLDASYGLVAPFIASYVLKSSPFICSLFRCKNCGFQFFESRFEESEVHTLYHDYRGFDYYSIRHSFEPWYTRSMNEGMGNNTVTINSRKGYFQKFLHTHIPIQKVKRLLDYGGDQGQFIPDNIAEECYVFEVSGVDPVPGVTRIDEISDLENQTYDIVILSAVLEHVSDPHAILRKIHMILSENGYLLLQVPYESFYYQNWFGDSLTRKYLNLLAYSPRQVMKIIDLYSTISKIKLHYIPPMGFAKLHEHLNFFSETSFYPLLKSAGFSVIALEKYYQPSQTGMNATFTCLARVDK
jgi:2-polyprenyl-3-methyl-5-hydroxy-6-metoxy-1,4-benzoquinol methylase